MELVKGQPGTVTLQKRHKGHDRAKKQKGRRAKKKKGKYRNTHTALTKMSSLYFWGKCHPAVHMESKQALQGRKAPYLARYHRALAHACPDATPEPPCLLWVQCLIRSKKQIPDANNLGCTAQCTGS